MNNKQEITMIRRNRDTTSVIMSRLQKLELNIEVMQKELQSTLRIVSALSDDLSNQAVSAMRQSR